jgi:hypothetical protein
MDEIRTELLAAHNPELHDRRAQRRRAIYPEYPNWKIPAYSTQAFLNRQAGRSAWQRS